MRYAIETQPLPCPFCDTALEQNHYTDGYAYWKHPPNGCIAQVIEAFEANGVPRWNRRTASPDAGGWRTMDSAPKDGTEIIIGREGDSEGPSWVTVARWLVEDESWYEMNNHPSDSWGFGALYPSRWQPLPSPPEPKP